MRPLTYFRLAPAGCLLLSLLYSSAPITGAWIHSSATKRTLPLRNEKRIGVYKPTSLGAAEGVMDFVNGLDSILENPGSYSAMTDSVTTPTVSSLVTAYEATAPGMNIPNSAVLAGGAVVSLSFIGLAIYFLTQQQGEGNDQQNGLNMNSFGTEEVVPVPNVNVNDEGLSQQLQAAETRFQEQQRPSTPVVKDATAVGGAGATEERVKEEGRLREISETKLEQITGDLALSRELLATETERRKNADSKLEEATAANEGLKIELETKEQALSETTEVWNVAKAQLAEMVKLKDTLENELNQAAEANRDLEDKYELEQNALTKTKKELDTTLVALESTEKRVSRTQGELIRVFGELQTTQQILSDTSDDLVELEDEQRSIRKLGKQIWRVSKSRVSERIRSVTDRLRGRGPKKNNNKKKY